MPTTTATLNEAYRPIREDLARVGVVFDEEIVSEFAFVNELCETVRSYRGKMIRPALLLLTGRACGDLVPAHDTLGAVIEMVHMATLVHDDVLDEADERRRRPTIRNLSGNAAAVLLGDYFISHAFHLCSSLDSQFASRRISHTTNVVCEGELLQNLKSRDVAISEDEYFEIIRRKTGALTAVACELGAKFAGAHGPVVTAMAEFGMSVGVAFQIVDDVLDVVGEEAEVGKTLGVDAALGKPTLPAIHCLANACGQTADALRDYLSGACMVDRATLSRWLNEAESLDYAMVAAGEHVDRAIERLRCVSECESRSALALMAEFIVARRC